MEQLCFNTYIQLQSSRAPQQYWWTLVWPHCRTGSHDPTCACAHVFCTKVTTLHLFGRPDAFMLNGCLTRGSAEDILQKSKPTAEHGSGPGGSCGEGLWVCDHSMLAKSLSNGVFSVRDFPPDAVAWLYDDWDMRPHFQGKPYRFGIGSSIHVIFPTAAWFLESLQAEGLVTSD